MKSFRKELKFNLPTRRAYVNITCNVQDCIDESGVKEGIVLVNAMNMPRLFTYCPQRQPFKIL